MLYWLTSLASLFGVWLNIRNHVACFWIWPVTNASWACVDFEHDIYPQAALHTAYFHMALYGIGKWRTNYCSMRKHHSISPRKGKDS